MNKAYFHLMEKALDCATMAHCIAKNSNYKIAIAELTDPKLEGAIKQLETSRRLLQEILSDQMKY